MHHSAKLRSVWSNGMRRRSALSWMFAIAFNMGNEWASSGDQSWRITHLLPAKPGERGRTVADKRSLVEAVLRMARSGAAVA
jgi:hypothetical protein